MAVFSSVQSECKFFSLLRSGVVVYYGVGSVVWCVYIVMKCVFV